MSLFLVWAETTSTEQQNLESQEKSDTAGAKSQTDGADMVYCTNAEDKSQISL